MKRKLIILLALSVATVGITACGNTETTETVSTEVAETTEAVTEDTETELVENTESTTTSSATTGTDSTTSSESSTSHTSESWPEYAETYDYMVEHTSEATAYMLNPDVYGTVTYGKGAQDLPQSKGQPDVADYIKTLDLTTTKGYYIEAYYYVEVGTVQFIYTGEVIPYGGMWMSDDESDEALNDVYGVSVMDITHQQKIDALGEPSMTAEEVISALGY